VKAAVFKKLGEPLKVESLPDPVPSPNEVVVQVARCGICGSDLHMTEDSSFGVAPGSVLGHEYAGEVVETGPAVTKFRPGDCVSVMPLRGCGQCAVCLAGKPSYCSAFQLEGGGYAQYSRAAEHQCVKLPSDISLEDAALAEPLSVALHGVVLSEMKMGAKVLVIGAGPIGLGAAFWARRLGAKQVAVTDLYNYQEDRAYEMGATAFLCQNENTVEKVNSALGGPPEVVFECVGRPGLVSRAIQHAGPRGTIVLLGLCTAPDAFVPFEAISKEVRIQTSAFFHAQEFHAAIDALEAGDAAPRALVTDTVALSGMPQAFEALRKRTKECKVLVDPRSH
jgi:(R,R)-butanediol dehydrogenase / meso-butanediol dehydrogenase / diacetyl reductase